MPYRVRSLSTVGPGVVDRTYQGRGAAGAFMSMSDQAGAVYEIDAQERSYSTAEEVEQSLTSGQLKSTDLVFESGKWTTFAESIEFEDVARGKAGFESFSRNARYVVAGFGAVALLFGYVLLRVLAHH